MSIHPKTDGIVFHWPRAYDLLLRIVWGRGEERYRSRVLDLAGLVRGNHVLDVGCGTGTLAISAKALVGSKGRVVGVDASKEMIARARVKAWKHRASIEFIEAPAQKLPLQSGAFDVVISTTVIHCLPEAQRRACYEEMARLLQPGGRLLLVDFGGSPEAKHSLFGHLHVHRRFDLSGEAAAIASAGLKAIAQGPIGFYDLHYLLAEKAGGHQAASVAA
ncbi:MAG TPA: class I SAM-dependent methyltransferase [Sphingomicrobium sp.]|nr:class I SAM-dependent methyltransferase [Sphingomicrobium sp.]